MIKQRRSKGVTLEHFGNAEKPKLPTIASLTDQAVQLTRTKFKGAKQTAFTFEELTSKKAHGALGNRVYFSSSAHDQSPWNQLIDILCFTLKQRTFREGHKSFSGCLLCNKFFVFGKPEGRGHDLCEEVELYSDVEIGEPVRRSSVIRAVLAFAARTKTIFKTDLGNDMILISTPLFVYPAITNSTEASGHFTYCDQGDDDVAIFKEDMDTGIEARKAFGGISFKVRKLINE